jgi:hypothetical protein
MTCKKTAVKERKKKGRLEFPTHTSLSVCCSMLYKNVDWSPFKRPNKRQKKLVVHPLFFFNLFDGGHFVNQSVIQVVNDMFSVELYNTQQGQFSSYFQKMVDFFPILTG